MESRVFELIRRSLREGWIDKLIVAAQQYNPGNAQLTAVAEELGLTSTGKPSEALERVIRQQSRFIDAMKFREELGWIEGRVCRIEFPVPEGKTNYGTGFLVGRDLVMTNYHVMERVISGQVHPANIICRFDYKRSADGTTVYPGTEHRLATEWLVGCSPPSRADEYVGGGIPSPEELDFALFKLEKAAGEEPLGGKGEIGAVKRGWIATSTSRKTLAQRDPFLILQHPMADPLKLALGTVLGQNENQTRIRHDAPTEPGSSGSPCFDADLTLVALHQSGDPYYPKFAPQPTYNQAVPITRVAEYLTQQNVAAFWNRDEN